MSVTQQAFVQYAGMAVAFVLGWLAHWHKRDHQTANCPHQGWNEERQDSLSWLHVTEIGHKPRMQCSYCGKVFPARLSPSARWSAESGREESAP